MISCYPHRSGPHSATIRETFSCGLKITSRDPQLDNMQRVRELETLGSKWDVSNKPSPQSSELCRRGGGKSAIARGGERLARLRGARIGTGV